MMMSDVCLFVAYVGPKSRTVRPRKTKIGAEVAHVTRDSDNTFKVKKSNVTKPLYSPLAASASCSGERGNVLAVGTYCYVVVCSALTGEERGGGIPWWPLLLACYSFSTLTLLVE